MVVVEAGRHGMAGGGTGEWQQQQAWHGIGVAV